MINQYPLWKYLLIAVILLAGAVYALPNLYGENPALQISATRGEQVNAAVSERVVEALRTAGVAHGEVELQDERLLVRFTDTDTQIKAADTLKQAPRQPFRGGAESGQRGTGLAARHQRSAHVSGSGSAGRCALSDGSRHGRRGHPGRGALCRRVPRFPA